MKRVNVTLVVPDWANYVAQDEDREIYAFENFPSYKDGIWNGRDGRMQCLGEIRTLDKPEYSLQEV